MIDDAWRNLWVAALMAVFIAISWYLYYSRSAAESGPPQPTQSMEQRIGSPA
ncbi:hypothetical protein [Sinorhizobium sp. BG8]|uniref:hypothetical protein n=1 Tax=Sinorhizobium sp. BG8 TaxID=2613773 RepID=UPI00193CB679|nr:hypothetical protein [Sinorhizobium sp. BG8]